MYIQSRVGRCSLNLFAGRFHTYCSRLLYPDTFHVIYHTSFLSIP